MALKSTYLQLVSYLQIPSELLNDIPLYMVHICDTCIHLTARLNELSKSCINTLTKRYECIGGERVKRIITHSPMSPDVKKTKHDCRSSLNGIKKPRKSLRFCEPAQRQPAVEEEYEVSQDHQYALLSPATYYHKRHVRSLMVSADRIVSPDEMSQLSSIISKAQGSSIKVIVKELMTIPVVANAFYLSYLLQLDSSLNAVCTTKEPSILRASAGELLNPRFLDNVLSELNSSCPLLLSTIITMCTPIHQTMSSVNYTAAVMYAMAAHSRNPQMSAMQKILTAMCVRHHAGNEVSLSIVLLI